MKRRKSYGKLASMLLAVVVLLFSSCALAPEEKGSILDKSGEGGGQVSETVTNDATETTEELTESGTIGFQRRADGIIAGSPSDYDIIFHVDDVTVTSTDLLDKESMLDEDFHNTYADSAVHSRLDENGVDILFTVDGLPEGATGFGFDPGRVIVYGGHRTLFTPFIDFDMNGLSVGDPYVKQQELLGEPTPDASLNKHQKRWRQIAADQVDSTEDYYVFENGEYLVVTSCNNIVYHIALIYDDGIA